MLLNLRFMARIGFRLALVGIVGTIFYQYIYKSLFLDKLGYNRVLEHFLKFDVECEKIDDVGLAGCADMWLHQESGMLYMACSDTKGRAEWFPSLNHLNASGRSFSDRIAVLDTRGSGTIKSRLTWLQTQNFEGIANDGTLNLHGFDIRVDAKDKKKLHVVLVNDRPFEDTGKASPFNKSQTGSNSTIEYFTTTLGGKTMTHKQTFANTNVETPRHVAWIDEHLFMFTNSHSPRSSSRGYSDLVLGGGSIGYCTPPSTECGITKSSVNLKVPNGIALGHDNLLYVPSSISGQIQVFSLEAEQRLRKVDTIHVPFPINNINVDKNGDIYAATVPVLHKAIKYFQNIDANIPSAMFRIIKLGSMGEGEGWGWNVVKMMEDDGNTLPATTVAVHDSQTGKMFLGGVLDPFISICEKIDGRSFSAQLELLNF
ncbi:a2e50a8b-2e38-4eac-8cdc-076ed41a2a1f [Sclerotinia trifoliorum]|uniref:A2e50a8b-2e38-4eac-8cdc-076ed41a2a1f n=1 Tax=Sclerotinia trifoliorum TaxID=28548 RepID=A0A8H2ZU19_9HELO|nr:a2e50a8b-2e38-4eac-8cdc-076ed41a2a1f [Sclerotinia trifoliorum]